MKRSELRPGPQFRKRYRILRAIGEGAMGSVHLAEDLELRRRVAVKFLLGDAWNELQRNRFFEEAVSLARLNHPHILRILDHGDGEENPFLVFEFVEGEELGALLRREAPLEPRRALELFGELASAMAFAHGQGVLHRDLKPANLMVSDQGLKVMDFGLAKREDRELQLTATGVIMGTPSYLSPEQARGEEVGPASDIYSAGVCLFQMLSGRLPFEEASVVELLQAHSSRRAPELRQFRPELPAALSEVLARALAKDPQARFADFTSFARAAEAALEEVGGGAQATLAGTLYSVPDRPRLPPPAARAAASAGKTLAPCEERIVRKGWSAGKRLLALAGGLALLGLLGAWFCRGRKGEDAALRHRLEGSLRIETGTRGALLRWTSPEAEIFSHELRSLRGQKPLLHEGEEGTATTSHALDLDRLLPGSDYEILLRCGSVELTRSFRCDPIRLLKGVSAIAALGVLHLDFRCNDDEDLSFQVADGGGTPLREGRVERGRGTVVVSGLPEKGSYRWQLRHGRKLLAAGRLPVFMEQHPPLLRRYAKGKLLLPRPICLPLFQGDRVLSFDDSGAVTSFRRRRVDTVETEAGPSIEIEWVFVPPMQGELQKGIRHLGAVTLLEGGRLLVAVGGRDGRLRFWRIDPELRARVWARRTGSRTVDVLPSWVTAEGDDWNAPLGPEEACRPVEPTSWGGLAFTPLFQSVRRGRFCWFPWWAEGHSIGWGCWDEGAQRLRVLLKAPFEAPADFERWERSSKADAFGGQLRVAFSYVRRGDRRSYGQVLLCSSDEAESGKGNTRVSILPEASRCRERGFLGRAPDGRLFTHGMKGLHSWAFDGRDARFHGAGGLPVSTASYFGSAVAWWKGRPYSFHCSEDPEARRSREEIHRSLGAEDDFLEAHRRAYRVMLVERLDDGTCRRFAPPLTVDRGDGDFLTVEDMSVWEGLLVGCVSKGFFAIDLEGRRFMSREVMLTRLSALAVGPEGLFALQDTDARISLLPAELLRAAMDKSLHEEKR